MLSNNNASSNNSSYTSYNTSNSKRSNNTDGHDSNSDHDSMDEGILLNDPRIPAEESALKPYSSSLNSLDMRSSSLLCGFPFQGRIQKCVL